MIPIGQNPVSDMVLNTLSFRCRLFQEKEDYRLGSLGKEQNGFGNGFKENKFLENLGMGQPCPSVSFYEMYLRKRMLEASEVKKMFSKNFVD